ncbi:MAG TPA: hypothetical protein VGB12_14090 [bacterium]
MWHNHGVSLAMTLLLAACTGCTTGPHGPFSGWAARGSSLSAEQTIAYLDEVSRLEHEAVPAEIQRLEVGAAEGSAGDQLKLAYLLSRTDCATADPDRAWELLKGLAPAFQDKGAQGIARLLGRTITLERQLGLARSKTTELQQKIERLKGLERQLDDSNSTIERLPAPADGSLSGSHESGQAPATATQGGSKS